MQPLSWNAVNADFICNNEMYWKVVQCSWHSFPILWFWFDFFLENTIDCPFERGDSPCNLILSFANLSENSLRVCFVWFSHLTILEWWQWSRLMFNQSIEILGFIPPFFCWKHRWVGTFDRPLCSLEAHARCPSLPQCKALRYQSLSFVMTL